MRQTGAKTAVLVGVVVLVGLGGGAPLAAQETDRAFGVAGIPTETLVSVPIEGNYWALLIGIDKYAHASNLESPVKDVQAVRAVLETRYGFHPSRIKQLLNAEATRNNIINTLYRLGREANREDSVFIYYAGHGQYDEAREHGWWVPTEGEPRQPGTLIENTTILGYIKGLQARHVYLVADSCFSGTLFGTRALPPINDRWYAELYKERSRWGLTSGGTEPVEDTGRGGHSTFAYFLVKMLRENEHPYLVPSTIHDTLAHLVANNTIQVPRSEPLRQSGDEGGQFVFRLTGAAPRPDSSNPVTSLFPDDTPSPSLEVTQLAMEREFWNAIKDSQHPQEFAAYLKRYPDGTFAELARQRLEGLAEEAERQQELAVEQLRREVQTGLRAVGFDPGPTDGQWSEGARRALEAFQRVKGMSVTGEPSKQLLAQLQRDLRIGWHNRTCRITETLERPESCPEECREVELPPRCDEGYDQTATIRCGLYSEDSCENGSLVRSMAEEYAHDQCLLTGEGVVDGGLFCHLKGKRYEDGYVCEFLFHCRECELVGEFKTVCPKRCPRRTVKQQVCECKAPEFCN